ncbi:glycosyltransferase family 39 protein [Micromonospora sp. ATA51]|nr:glycosyltransferase family 39 protein [Micromonospora sp. ATA51]
MVWLPPAALTLAVSLTEVSRAQLWRDELATWSAATRPVGDLVRLAGTIDAATGPYYLLMHGWIALFGDSTTALRLPSVLAMAATAGLTARLGERLVDARVGLLAGLLLAVLPGTSRYAQEARPYALATLLAVLATLLLVEALRRPSWARWAGYAAAVAALGLTHLIALTLLAAHAVAVLLVQWRDPAAAGLDTLPDGAERPPTAVGGTTRRPMTGPTSNRPAAGNLATPDQAARDWAACGGPGVTSCCGGWWRWCRPCCWSVRWWWWRGGSGPGSSTGWTPPG